MTVIDQTHPVATAAVEAMTDVAVEAPALPDAIVANARELDDLRTAKKVLEEREGVLRAALLDHLDSIGQDAVTDGTVTVSRSNSERKGIDRAKMEALYPKVLAAVTTSTPVVQVRVKIKG
jgi:hypothetical protein